MRKSLKKVLATGLAATMALSMTACNVTGDGALTLILTGYAERHGIKEGTDNKYISLTYVKCYNHHMNTRACGAEMR